MSSAAIELNAIKDQHQPRNHFHSARFNQIIRPLFVPLTAASATVNGGRKTLTLVSRDNQLLSGQ